MCLNLLLIFKFKIYIIVHGLCCMTALTILKDCGRGDEVEAAGLHIWQCSRVLDSWKLRITCIWGINNKTHSYMFHTYRWQNRRLRQYWTRAWSCFVSYRRKTYLRDTTNSIWLDDFCSIRVCQMTPRKIWSQN